MGNREEERANELGISNISFPVGRWSRLKAHTFRYLAECLALAPRSSPHQSPAWAHTLVFATPFGRVAQQKCIVEPNPTGFADLSWCVSLARCWAYVRRLEEGRVNDLGRSRELLQARTVV